MANRLKLLRDYTFDTLGFQTPWRYLDPKNIPKTPSQDVFGRLGIGKIKFKLLFHGPLAELQRQKVP